MLLWWFPHLQGAWSWGWKDERESDELESALPIRKGHGKKGQVISLPPWPPRKLHKAIGWRLFKAVSSCLGQSLVWRKFSARICWTNKWLEIKCIYVYCIYMYVYHTLICIMTNSKQLLMALTPVSRLILLAQSRGVIAWLNIPHHVVSYNHPWLQLQIWCPLVTSEGIRHACSAHVHI